MPLHLHRAQRSDALVAGLADLLREPLDDPMATEIVAVPARGIERWLTQRLSHRLGTEDNSDGVCANIDFSSPSSLVQRTISAVSGVDPDADPWRVDRLIWPMIATIDACSGEPWCAALADHLGAAPDAAAGERTELRRARRLAVAHRLAGLFDAYSSYRPSVLQQWAAGANTNGMDEPLAAQRVWQPELFRRLREGIGVPSPAERLPAVCRTLQSDLTIVDLPSRISVFGPTRLSATELVVFDGLAESRDVHIWIPQPSPTLWDRLAGVHRDQQPPRRRKDPTASEPVHPLLRSLGRDSREFQLRLGNCHSTTFDHLYPDIGRAPGVLGQLQTDLATDNRPPDRAVGSAPDRRPRMAAGDRSIQMHACHGRARQVEVLRDVLVGLLADDDTLQPRDLLVMCPDIEMYAPFILAAFGAPGAEPTDAIDGSHPGTRIRVRLADRALRRTNPVLDVLARLLELAESRMSASQVLDFAGLPPVRRRFGFDDDDLQRLREWVVDSGIRWGLNSAARAPYGLGELRQNTWRAGLDRILLGVAMSEDEPDYLGLALPLDDVDSSDIDLAGRLAELVDRLAIGLRSLTGVRPLADWAASLVTAIESLAAVADADSWQLDQARRTIGEATTTAGEQALTVPLRLADVERLMADALRGRPTRANFRTGELTICSMVPMRSVPHRVVCLLGLDDGEFPRTGRVDGDDVLAVDPVVGERDRTSEDRQLLLDAIDAATEHLIFLYSGADERTGALRPPAAALGEILDVLDASVLSADGGPARDQLLIRHPLQPFDSRNFVNGALMPGRPYSLDRPFSFDLAGLAGAAAERSTAPPPPFLSGPLPAPELLDTIDLDALIRFFEQPAKTFLRDRLGIYGGLWEDEVPDELAVSLDSLQKWSIGERLLQSRLVGASSEAVQQAEFRRGTLPPGSSGPLLLQELAGNVDPLVQAAAGYLAGVARQVDVTAGLPDGRALAGTIGPLRAGVLTRVTYSSLAPKHRIRAWISILALAAADPSFAVRAVTIGRGGKYQPVAISRLDPPSPDRATALLATLVGIRDFGLRSPLPLPPKTAYAYALARVRGRRDAVDAFAKAETEWKGRSFPGEGAQPEHTRIWGENDLMTIATSLGRAESPGETTRFGELAVQIYQPLLDAEELGE
ncbi:MAG: exodeoxyribonuclease V subunit gamma [Nakamurella sp.]